MIYYEADYGWFKDGKKSIENQNITLNIHPTGYEEEGDKRTRLMTKGIIYEVKLLDWVERVDIEADGNFLKTFINKPPKKHWEMPKERDEVCITIKAFY